MSGRQQALFDQPTTTGDGRGGPVYQGVCQQIRSLFPTGREAGHKARCKCAECVEVESRKDAVAGWIASARSIAASIDRVSGAGGRQASGVQLAAMHERLDQVLARLTPASDQRDPFDEFLDELADDEQEVDGVDGTAQPHAAQ